jgi:NADH-quinone oxidoreductase subunit C
VGLEGVPGLVETREAYGETTLIIDPARVLDACTCLRDEEGFNVLVDLCATDYLGWGTKGVAGYIGTVQGRDMHAPGSQGFGRTPSSKPARFSINYHVLKLDAAPQRLRVQAWLEDGVEIDSVVGVWPAADWYEREVYDLMGVTFRGHPNMTRILMDDDWEGHPLRKDYPIGGEPVRFSGEE